MTPEAQANELAAIRLFLQSHGLKPDQGIIGFLRKAFEGGGPVCVSCDSTGLLCKEFIGSNRRDRCARCYHSAHCHPAGVATSIVREVSPVDLSLAGQVAALARRVEILEHRDRQNLKENYCSGDCPLCVEFYARATR